MLEMSGVCRKPFTLALLKESFWLAPWPEARSVAAPRSEPCPTPVPGDACGAVPAVGAVSCRGRESHRQRELRPRAPSRGDRGYPLLPAVGGGGFPPSRSEPGCPGCCWPESCRNPAQGRPAPDGVAPREEPGAWRGGVGVLVMRVCAPGSDPHAPRPAAPSPLVSGGKKQSEDLGQGSPAQQRAPGPWDLGGRLNPGLPGAAAGERLPIGTGSYCPRHFSPGGPSSTSRVGRAPVPRSPPALSSSTSGPGAAVGPTRLCLRLTQRRVPSHPRLQRSALQVSRPPATAGGDRARPPAGQSQASAPRPAPPPPRRGTEPARPAVLPGRTPAAPNGEARKGRGRAPIGSGGRRSRDLKLE